MSDKQKIQDTILMILRNIENYPPWKSYTISKLQ